MKLVTIATVLVVCFVAGPTRASVLYQAWGTAETSKFCKGVGPLEMNGCFGRAEWQGNDLILEYRQEYGSAAWANTFNIDYYVTDVPSPANAVGIAFDVSSTYYPTGWAVNLDLGGYVEGISASVVVHHVPAMGESAVSTGGGGGTLPGGELTKWSYFPQLEYQYAAGVWSVSMYFPDQWLFNRDDLMQRINFFATNTYGGPDNLIDGITRFDNVSWILSDPFPIPPDPPPPNGGIPEPATLSLVGAALLGLAASRRRRPATPTP